MKWGQDTPVPVLTSKNTSGNSDISNISSVTSYEVTLVSQLFTSPNFTRGYLINQSECQREKASHRFVA